MDIATINQELANLNVKFATVKDKDMADENYTVGVSVIDSLSDMLDKIASTQYKPEDIPQVLGTLRGPVKTLVQDLKKYEERRKNMLLGEYEITKKNQLEAEQALEAIQNNEGQSFEDFLNQPAEEQTVEPSLEQQANQVEQNLQLQQVREKKLVPQNNNAA